MTHPDVIRDHALAVVREVMLGCIVCGNVHTFRKANKFDEDQTWTWAAPGDGHSYRRRWLGLDRQDAEEIIQQARIVLAKEER